MGRLTLRRRLLQRRNDRDDPDDDGVDDSVELSADDGGGVVQSSDDGNEFLSPIGIVLICAALLMIFVIVVVVVVVMFRVLERCVGRLSAARPAAERIERSARRELRLAGPRPQGERPRRAILSLRAGLIEWCGRTFGVSFERFLSPSAPPYRLLAPKPPASTPLQLATQQLEQQREQQAEQDAAAPGRNQARAPIAEVEIPLEVELDEIVLVGEREVNFIYKRTAPREKGRDRESKSKKKERLT
jgi:hypothetical protein